MDDWALHFNHYQDRSCEYFIRVKMVRGSVINGESDKMHNLDYYRRMEGHTNAWADDELARKRGADWPSRLLRPREAMAGGGARAPIRGVCAFDRRRARG